MGRYFSLRYDLNFEDEGIGALVLDMFLRGASGRPSIQKILGNLEWEYERRYDTEWSTDLY